MKRRLFIAINLDPQTRRAIGRIEKDIAGAFNSITGGRIRFMPEENWHITISFLGTQDDEDLTAIMRAMHAVAERFSAVEISFAEAAYAPRKDNPRMIWLKTSRATSEKLGRIKKSLENSFAESGIRFERESRIFSGHITLARDLGLVPMGGLPKIERACALNCTGTSLDLMESELSRNGAAYTVLQTFSFAGMRA